MTFHEHQSVAIEAAGTDESCVLTTGTGKSLAYIVPIVDRVLRKRGQGSRGRRSEGDHRLRHPT
ncbi:hypothetical protein GCM10010439_70330 [Actinocorallia aurantiaca]|uniref:DEAD/DEAH box helicase domain-containing protein n=1 Tax=Actinocorallia aurantiaca TaxID=46204 RepID=A0ABP6H7L6_9ACTN